MSEYLHGSSDAEQERLALMNEILNARELEQLRLRGDERILDLGAGTGLFARLLARAAPRGTVVAIERDERQAERARRVAADTPNLEIREGDGSDLVLAPAEAGTFDLVHARFLLEHVQRPETVVAAMVRAARPGGRLVLVDDDHAGMRLWPIPEGFERLWDLYVHQYELLRTDPYVGRRLPALLAEAGARPSRSGMIFYGGCAGDPDFPAVVENLAEVFEGAAERILEGGAIGAEELGAIVERFRRWGSRPGSALWYALPIAEAVR